MRKRRRRSLRPRAHSCAPPRLRREKTSSTALGSLLAQHAWGRAAHETGPGHEHPLAGCGKSWNPLRSSTDPKGNEEEAMRGEDRKADGLFSYLRPEQRVPADHPLRPIREMVDIVLRELSPEFARLYAPNGRPSIPPEKLLRALLLQVLYSVRSERQLMEQLNYNLLFRWFVGL